MEQLQHPSPIVDLVNALAGRFGFHVPDYLVFCALIVLFIAAIGLFILPRAWSLGGEALRVLVQAAPAHADPAVVAAHLGAIDGVVGVHDLHIWTLTSQMDVVTAHLAIAPGVDHDTVLGAGRRVLAEEFGLDHVILQVEPAPTAGTATPDCDHPSW